MGLAMVHVTRTIISPKDGKHIEMRIGIHSGPCMAGIVGNKYGKILILPDKKKINVSSQRIINASLCCFR